MFGKNPIMKPEYGDGRSLRLVQGSPFATLQGEGPYIGWPATFIRLHGCNLRCTFCDTNFSDPDDPVWATADIINTVKILAMPLVVITGGEPLRQNIMPLCHVLTAAGFKVQIETAGTLWQDDLEICAELVVSPKTATLNDSAYAHAIAFKYVIDVQQAFADDSYIPTAATQPASKPRRLAAPRPGAPVYLSPMDTYDKNRNALNRELVSHLAMKHRVIAGVQLHKILGLNEPS